MAHDHYVRVPNYRELTPADEQALLDRHLNRVTDTCIPEGEAMRRIEKVVLDEWHGGRRSGASGYFPHEFFYRLLRSGADREHYQIDPKDCGCSRRWRRTCRSSCRAGKTRRSATCIAAHCITGDVKNVHTVRTGIEYMVALAEWYTSESAKRRIGFFQIGGGIAGDFPICVVPMLHQDLQRDDVPLWGYFCQISDSTTSYGSYSGAVPNEKITWGKLGVETPKFVIESDATIVAPLLFAYVLNW